LEFGEGRFTFWLAVVFILVNMLCRQPFYRFFHVRQPSFGVGQRINLLLEFQHGRNPFMNEWPLFQPRQTLKCGRQASRSLT
jgi:hypothetical protein